jgi:lipopolysaccharide export system permease protein
MKMTVNGIWQPWQGMWLSSAVLLPLGIFLTYKATTDSAIMNIDTYMDKIKKIAGTKTILLIQQTCDKLLKTISKL